MRIVSCILGVALLASAGSAQTRNREVTENKLSPAAETSMKLQGLGITIEYSAPSARGREVEGGLIPYDRWWRLGADAATTLTTETDVMIGDLRVSKGVYTLYLVAKPDEWKLVVNKQTGQWGTTYSESEDLGRVPVKLTRFAQPVETLTIKLASSGKPEGTLTITWGRTLASVPVKLAR